MSSPRNTELEHPTNAEFIFLQDGGEMGELIRSIDWSQTPIGSPSTWPPELRHSVSLMLNNLFPMYIAWGPEYTQLYNDGYRPILGASKHPQAMGISTCETFTEIWDIVGPMFKGVMDGKAVGFPDFKLMLDRNGFLEECYFDFCYSPIKLEDGSVGGVLVTVIEITEKYHAFKSLKQAKLDLEMSQAETAKERDRLKKFFMQSPAGICILEGPDMVYELINPPYQELFPGRQLLGKPLLEAVPEIEGAPIYQILKDVYRTGNTFEGSELLIPLARQEGGPIEDRYFNFSYQARIDTLGKVDGIMVFVFEVTEIVNAKRRVEESEKRFRSMIAQSPVALLVNRGDELVFDVINQPMIDIIGKGETVKGKPWHEAIPELVGQPIVERLYHTYHTGEEWHGYEVPIMLNKGGEHKVFYFNLTYRPLIENQRITGLLQSAVDVTEQVEARKQLEKAQDSLMLALQAAELGTFDNDVEKGTLTWDKRCRALFGIRHDEPVTFEKDFINGLHPDDKERVLSIVAHVLNKEASNGDYDIEYRTIGAGDKKVRWVRAKGKAYFDEHDKPVRFTGAVLDITEQKTDELRKNDFIGMVSHELKTPLTTMMALVQILQKRAGDPDDGFRATALDKANNQVKKMSIMINSFLNVSRLESGKIHLNMQNFNLDDLVKEMIEEAKITLPTHQITCCLCPSIMVNADKDKIGSVVSNLLSNAVKYSPRGKNIKVDCEFLDNYAKVTVTDEGMGISREDSERIFERYYRVQNHNREQISGFGIGLYVSSEIIERHYGQIGVDSTVGKGSAFWFTLPLA